MLSLGLKLLGIGAWIKKAAYALLCGIKSYPREAAIVALLLALAWTWHGKSKAIEQRDVSRLALKIFARDVAKASREAEAKQKAADQTNIAGQLAAIKQQDAANVQLEAARKSAVAEYIRTHAIGRIVPAAVSGSPSGAGSAPMRDNPRPPVDGQAPGDLVAVRPEQIEAWSEIELQNTERGQFLRGLVDQGLAIPQSALPEPAFGGK